MNSEDAVANRWWPVRLAGNSVCLSLLGLGVLLSLGCAKERGVTPAPTKYRATLIAADIYPGAEYVVRTLDLSTGTIGGEVPIGYGGGIFVGLAVTPDGQHCATLNKRGDLQVIDLRSLSVTHEMSLFPGITSSLHFLPIDSLKLLVSCYAVCTSAVYDLPAGAIDTVLPGSLFGFSSPDQSELVTMSTGGLTRRSYETWDIVDSFSFVSPVGNRVYGYEAEASPAYDGIYILGADAAGDAIYRYNLVDHSCTFRQSILPNLSRIARFAVSPDGREIWVLQGGGVQSPIEDRGYILVLDGSTGAPLDTIRTVGLWEQYPEYSFALTAIEFHPDEPVAYVAAYAQSPSMLVIDRSSRAVVGSYDVGYVSQILIHPSRNTSGQAL